MRRVSATIVIAFYCFLVSAGNNIKSVFYNNTNRLIADTTFSISKTQLKRFAPIENQLANEILNSSIYSPVYRENNIEFDAVVSFILHKDGTIDSVQIERLITGLKDFHISPESAFFRDMILNPIIKNSKQFLNSGFKACSKSAERYYLPFRFRVGETEIRKVEHGWLFYQGKRIKAETQQIIQDGK